MARFRKIDTRLWADSRFIALSKPHPCGQSLWIYLMTGPHCTNVPGLFSAGEAGLAEALGWTTEAFREAFREVLSVGYEEDHAQPLAKADWKARVVYLPTAITYNPPQSPNVVVSWGDSWSEIADCTLKTDAWNAMDHALSLIGKGYREAFRKTCPKPKSKPSAKAMPEQEQEQEQEQECVSARAQEPTDTHTPSPTSEFIEPWPKSATSPVIAPHASQSTTTPPKVIGLQIGPQGQNAEKSDGGEAKKGQKPASTADRAPGDSKTCENVANSSGFASNMLASSDSRRPPQREDGHRTESQQAPSLSVNQGTLHTPTHNDTFTEVTHQASNFPITAITAPGRTGGSHTPTPPPGIATTGTGGASGNGSKPDPVGRSEWCESVEASWPPRVVEVFLAWRSTFVAPDVKPPKLRQSDHDPIAAALRWDFEPSDIADSFRGWLKDELRCPNGVPAPMMTSIKSLLKTPDVITQGIMHAKARVGVAPSTRPESRAPVSDLPPKMTPEEAKAKLIEIRKKASGE